MGDMPNIPGDAQARGPEGLSGPAAPRGRRVGKRMLLSHDAPPPDPPAMRWSPRRALLFIIVSSSALWGLIVFALYVLFVVVPSHVPR